MLVIRPEQPATDVKTPSHILYDGVKAVAFGRLAELAYDPESPTQTLLKNFKLALHPDYMRKNAVASNVKVGPTERLALLALGDTFELPKLPTGVTISKVYADFVSFLLEHTKARFCSSRVNGKQLWDRLLPKAQFIAGCPNAWSQKERQTMKEAICLTRFCSNSARITVVTEAEASLHYLMNLEGNTLSLEVSQSHDTWL